IINDEILVTIEDDGKGFDAVAAQSKISFGILGMKERILSLNGTFQLISVIGKGTKIAIALPLTV
ncbi:MAG: ATP-binding protein, partial [Ferruginibacter sp.]